MSRQRKRDLANKYSLVLDLWCAGFDTYRIAKRLNIGEPEAQRIIWQWREAAVRAKEAADADWDKSWLRSRSTNENDHE